MTDFKHVLIVGCGTTQAEAALEFVNDFHRQMPKKKGQYDLFIRQPLSYDTEQEYGTGKISHQYRMRGSWNCIASLHEEEGIATNLSLK